MRVLNTTTQDFDDVETIKPLTVEEQFNYRNIQEARERDWSQAQPAWRSEEQIYTSFERVTGISRSRYLGSRSELVQALINAQEIGLVEANFKGPYDKASRVNEWFHEKFKTIGVDNQSLDEVLSLLPGELFHCGEVFWYMQRPAPGKSTGKIVTIESINIGSSKQGVRNIAVYRNALGTLRSEEATIGTDATGRSTYVAPLPRPGDTLVTVRQVIEEQGLLIDPASSEVVYYRYGTNPLYYGKGASSIQVGVDFSDNTSILLEAQHVVHMRHRVRPNNRRGIPLSAVCLDSIRDLCEMDSALLMKVKQMAYMAAFLEVEDLADARQVISTARRPDADDDLDPSNGTVPTSQNEGLNTYYNNPRPMKMQSGVVLPLKPGQKYNFVQAHGDFNGLLELVTHKLRIIAAACNTPLEVVLYLFGSYASSRQTMTRHKATLLRTRDEITDKLLVPLVRFMYNSDKVTENELQLRPEQLKEIHFLWSKIPELDEEREASARAIQLLTGTKTLEEMAHEDGKTLHSLLASTDRSIRLAMGFARGLKDEKNNVKEYEGEYPDSYILSPDRMQAAAQAAHANEASATAREAATTQSKSKTQ